MSQLRLSLVSVVSQLCLGSAAAVQKYVCSMRRHPLTTLLQLNLYLYSADDFSNLLVSSKGWLCTLEHKSCQQAC